MEICQCMHYSRKEDREGVNQMDDAPQLGSETEA